MIACTSQQYSVSENSVSEDKHPKFQVFLLNYVHTNTRINGKEEE